MHKLTFWLGIHSMIGVANEFDWWEMRDGSFDGERETMIDMAGIEMLLFVVLHRIAHQKLNARTHCELTMNELVGFTCYFANLSNC